MSSFALGCCPGFIWTLVTPLVYAKQLILRRQMKRHIFRPIDLFLRPRAKSIAS